MNAIKLYRVERWLYLKKNRGLARVISGLIYVIYNSYIPFTCSIGKYTEFAYKGIGVVIHANAIVGNNCIIGTNVTIGGNFHNGMNNNKGVPIIGDKVWISTGAKILGGIKVGNNVVIGANSVVISDVPSNSVVAGVPTRVVKSDIDISMYF